MSTPHMTPFGPIPRGYIHLNRLCAMSHIAMRVEKRRVAKTLPKDAPIPEKQKLRDNPIFEEITLEHWYVVQDSQLVPTTYKSSTGKTKKNEKFMVRAANDHLRFQMLLDYVTWKVQSAFERFPKNRPSKVEILDVCIGEAPGVLLPDGQTLLLEQDVKKYSLLPWNDLNNVCANADVPGYALRGSQAQHATSMTVSELSGVKSKNYGGKAAKLPF